MNTGMNKPTPQSDHWETPKWLYRALDTEFGFTFDPCPLHADFDGLTEDWRGERLFINPPYSDIEPWVAKAFSSEIAVILLPVRTGSHWFQMLRERDVEIRFLRKRIAFLQNGKEMKGPRFESMIAVVRGR